MVWLTGGTSSDQANARAACASSGVAPGRALELLGDELERAALIGGAVDPNGVLEEDERLLEWAQRGSGRRQGRRRRRWSESRPRPGRVRECDGPCRRDECAQQEQKDERARIDSKRRCGKREEIRPPRHRRPRVVGGDDVGEPRVDAHRGHAHGDRALVEAFPSTGERDATLRELVQGGLSGRHAGPSETAKDERRADVGLLARGGDASLRASDDLPGREVGCDANGSGIDPLRVEHDVDGRADGISEEHGAGSDGRLGLDLGWRLPSRLLGRAVVSSQRREHDDSRDQHHERRQAERRKSTPSHRVRPRSRAWFGAGRTTRGAWRGSRSGRSRRRPPGRCRGAGRSRESPPGALG